MMKNKKKLQNLAFSFLTGVFLICSLCYMLSQQHFLFKVVTFYKTTNSWGTAVNFVTMKN